MFGRSGGPVPKTTRIVVGVIATLLGAFSAWVGVQAATGYAGDTEGSPWIAILFGVMMGGLGLMLLVGAFAGVGDSGERPAAMRLLTRLFIDLMGFLFLFGFAFFMGAAAYQSATEGEPGASTVSLVIGFGFFAVVLGGFALYVLLRTLIRALRGQPYDDGAPVKEPE